jgi:predicted deacylase
MLPSKFKVSTPKNKPIEVLDSTWIRAGSSGMFKSLVSVGKWVEKGGSIGQITDPYGQTIIFVLAPNTGYIFNVNHAPTVYQGDAIFHMSTEIKKG